MENIEISVKVKSHQLDRMMIMKKACDLCHYPRVITDEVAMSEHCDSCPMRAYLFSDGGEGRRYV